MRSLHCYEPSQNQINFVPLLVQMIPKEDYDIQVKTAMCEMQNFAELCRISHSAKLGTAKQYKNLQKNAEIHN